MNRKKIERPKSVSPMTPHETKNEHLGSKDSQDIFFDDLANLVSEINLKQKLTKELELSQRRLSDLQQHYEDKLQKLQTTIKLTQEERNTVLSSLNSNINSSGITKKVQDDYEQKLNSMQKELKSLQTAKTEHAKHLKDHEYQYENQLQNLKHYVDNEKRSKINPMGFNKIKDETTKHQEVDLKKAHLKKDSIEAEVRMINLESKSRSLDAALKRKQEELTANVEKPIYNIRKDAEGNYAYQKSSKQTWIDLEKDISTLILNKQTSYSLKKHMERLLREQKKIQSELDYKQQKLSEAQIQKSSDVNFHRELENVIEAIKANLDYVNESLKELHENILQIEDNKTVSESLELTDRVHNLPEAIHVLEKLVQMFVDKSCLATQNEIHANELETKMQQLEKENKIQKQLIEHMLSSRKSANDMSTSMPTKGDRRNVKSVYISSTSSSGSAYHTDKTSTNSINDSDKNKHKYRTSLAKEALNDSENEDKKHSRAPGRLRVPIISSLLRRDKCKPSPDMARKKFERQKSMTPSLKREGTFVITIPNPNLQGKPSLKLDALNIPKSTPPRRRTYTSSCSESVLSRQFSNSPLSMERAKGIIRPYQEKTSLKAPLACTHITEGHSDAVLGIYVTEDKLFTASKDKTVKIWDLHTGKEIKTLGDHPNSAVAVKYDQYAQLVYSASSSYVRVWDMRESKSIKTLSSSGIVNNGSVMASQIPIGEIQLNDIALNNNGRTLYMVTGDKVKIWDLRKFTVRGKLISGHTAAVMCLAVGQFDNKDIIVTGSKDHYIKMFEVGVKACGTYNPSVTLEPPHYDGIQTLALRNQMLFSGSRDYALRKWDLDKQELITSINNAHNDWICGLAVVPDQPLLASVCRRGSLKIWSESTCSLLSEIKAHDSPINALATNSTHVFTAANDGTVKLWQVNSNLDAMA